MSTYRKSDHGNPRTLQYEVAGLRWLAEASRAGGVAVAEIVAVWPDALETRIISQGAPTEETAEAFGRALARTHAAGAPHHGCPPAGFDGHGFMGRAALPLRPAPPEGGDPWGEFYATDRILPYLEDAVANGSIDDDGARSVQRCAERVGAGTYDAPQPALVDGVARLHGDLWSGNVLWAPGTGATLIDPAAQGGHAESDLAQLTVFGAPFLDRVLAAYDEVSPLADGWRERVGLHQLHILIVHAALFGGPYGARTVSVAARYA